jgi:hypothetical protein
MDEQELGEQTRAMGKEEEARKERVAKKDALVRNDLRFSLRQLFPTINYKFTLLYRFFVVG